MMRNPSDNLVKVGGGGGQFTYIESFTNGSDLKLEPPIIPKSEMDLQ